MHFSPALAILALPFLAAALPTLNIRLNEPDISSGMLSVLLSCTVNVDLVYYRVQHCGSRRRGGLVACGRALCESYFPPAAEEPRSLKFETSKIARCLGR